MTICPDRQYHCARSSAQRGCEKKPAASKAIGWSKGGLSTKTYALADALDNSIGFHLTLRQACDLEGSDHLLSGLKADTLLAERNANKTVGIPPKSNRKNQCLHKRNFIKHVISSKTFFVSSNNFEPSPRATIKPLVIALPPSIWHLPSSGYLATRPRLFAFNSVPLISLGSI